MPIESAAASEIAPRMPHQPTTSRSRRGSPGATGSSANATRTAITSSASATPIASSRPASPSPTSSTTDSSCRPSSTNSSASSPNVMMRQNALAVSRVSASKYSDWYQPL